MADTQTAEAAEATEQQTTPAGDDSVQVQEAELPESTDQPSSGGGQIDILLESAMPVSIQLGQVSVRVRELLQLTPGSVLKLDKKVGEPVDVFLRGTRFATGQLVVIGDRLGVRIKDILSQAQNQDSEEQN